MFTNLYAYMCVCICLCAYYVFLFLYMYICICTPKHERATSFCIWRFFSICHLLFLAMNTTIHEHDTPSATWTFFFCHFRCFFEHSVDSSSFSFKAVISSNRKYVRTYFMLALQIGYLFVMNTSRRISQGIYYSFLWGPSFIYMYIYTETTYRLAKP